MPKTTVVNRDTYKGEYIWIGGGVEPFTYSFFTYQCPFKIGPNGTRAEVMELYRGFFYRRLAKSPHFRIRVHELWGKVLGCECVPDHCHGDIIAEYLNGLTREEAKTW